MAFRTTEGRIGEFQEQSHDKWFTYRKSQNPWGISHDLPHEIDVVEGFRPARVLKTCAYVAINEGAESKPVIERWDLKKHHIYPEKSPSQMPSSNEELAQWIKQAWERRGGMRIGDFVRLPNGQMRRFAHDWGDGLQTCKEGSFYISRTAGVEFSGALQSTNRREHFHETKEVQNGKFWTFSMGIVGAGRAWYFELPCKVFELKPETMSEAQARAHPLAIEAAKNWGDQSNTYRERLQELMKPQILRHPEYF